MVDLLYVSTGRVQTDSEVDADVSAAVGGSGWGGGGVEGLRQEVPLCSRSDLLSHI